MSASSSNMNMSMSLAEVRVSFMRRVYNWMVGGILLTAFVAYYIGNNEDIVMTLLRTPILFYGMMFAQIGMVLALSMAIEKLSVTAATLLYLGYAALTGVTLSIIFVAYTHESIASAFFTTSCGFAGLSVIGYFTKRDLGPVGTFCGMALFGLIGWALLSMFFPSMMAGQMSAVYSIAGLVIFSGLTAYDTQKIKNMAYNTNRSGQVTDAERKGAIYGALTLYLDFINLFLMVLRLFGDRRK